ncbi:peptidyl-tRNA hydrolase [Luteococcus sp. Sow4_B9]|uniref:peptidyl-tRNA hydrolase n=1 Tax=Luteococcus sp. Sow4_B9 TaxID=3438792 RepID=UPI003F9D5590
MQFAVRYDKQNPATHVDTCEAVARACVALLASPEARDGEWREAVDFWRDGRIRKLVRRARGEARWVEVQTVPGVTIEQGGGDDEGVAGARAFVPAPVRPLGPVLKKLQVEGTELPDTRPSRTEGALVTVGVSPHITMTTGKAAAQCAHAAQLAWEAMDQDTRERWQRDDFRLRVEVVEPARWAADAGRVEVVDAGFTELDGPTPTTRAWW